MLTLGSLFDGSGGFPLAGEINGIVPRWIAEIEPFPCRVTAKRFPDIPNHGDVTKINGAEIEPVDIVTFGSPCQDLSIAGKQKGIHDGERSSLFFEAIRIIREMREHDRATGRADQSVRPRYAVWENVPGAFSSNRGEDFRAVLQTLCEVRDKTVSVPVPPRGGWTPAGCIVGDGYSIAWRVYDAQYWGVPQRRKRIYLVADFAGERAGEILFEPDGLPGDSAPGSTAGKATSADVERSPGGSGICWDARGNGGGGIAPTLTGDHQNRVTDYTAIVARCQSMSQYAIDGTASTMKERDHKGGAVDVVIAESGKTRKYIIRRLTPLECCRLQGFPDAWDADVDGSDSARYKMWGSGVALPCVVDVLGRIARAARKEASE